MNEVVVRTRHRRHAGRRHSKSVQEQRVPPRDVPSPQELAALRAEIEQSGFELVALGPTCWMTTIAGELYAAGPRELAARIRQLQSIRASNETTPP